MIKVNEYFDRQVCSIAFANAQGNATVGVMEAGEYEFGTSCVECMTVVSGALDVLLPNAIEWKTCKQGETFIVPANVRFKVIAREQTAYLCFYR